MPPNHSQHRRRRETGTKDGPSEAKGICSFLFWLSLAFLGIALLGIHPHSGLPGDLVQNNVARLNAGRQQALLVDDFLVLLSSLLDFCVVLGRKGMELLDDKSAYRHSGEDPDDDEDRPHLLERQLIDVGIYALGCRAAVGIDRPVALAAVGLKPVLRV